MYGKHFTVGISYRDNDATWRRVLTRGPVSTHGKDITAPIVRLTVDPGDGTTERAVVLANQDYEVRDDASGRPRSRREWIVPPGTTVRQEDLDALTQNTSVPEPSSRWLSAAPRRLQPASMKPDRRKARPASLSGRENTAGTTAASRHPDLTVPPPTHSWPREACYWLPTTTRRITATQYEVMEALSCLLWVDAPAARWREGEPVEHDPPAARTIHEITATVQDTDNPNPRQIRATARIINELLKHKFVERCGPERYRLRGWECLHTRRRETRRAIEKGGGRALYERVRFSA